MKAMVLNGYHEELVLQDIEVPEPKAGEILVKVAATGLCGTDLKVIKGLIPVGPLPHILGHEIAGTVVGLGEGADPSLMGKRVALHLYNSCGVCKPCKEGAYNMCATVPPRLGFELPGGLGEYVTCKAHLAVEIPDQVSFTDACVVPCAILTIYHAMQKANIKQGDRVALLGVGGLGIHGVQFLPSMGAEVTAVDVIPEKLEMARQLGAQHAILYDEFASNGEKYDVIVDMIGRVQFAHDNFNDKLDRSGRYILISFVGGNENSFDAQHMAMDECQILGVRNGTINDMREALDLVARGILKPIIDRVVPLDQTNEALDLLRAGKVMGRVVVTHEA